MTDLRGAPGRIDRALAAAAGVFAIAGGATFAVAVLATQGLHYAGYVSEAGVVGEPYSVAYRLGIVGLGAALLSLAGAVRWLLPWAALSLTVSALLAFTSGAVPCSEGCPLPPFETPTTADLVHGATSVIGVGLCGLAVLLLAVFGPVGGVRRVSRLASAPIVALGLVNAYGIVFVGRGELTGLAERTLLVLIVGWCLAVAAVLLSGMPRSPSPRAPTARRP
jgi:hypothetical protein